MYLFATFYFNWMTLNWCCLIRKWILCFYSSFLPLRVLIYGCVSNVLITVLNKTTLYCLHLLPCESLVKQQAGQAGEFTCRIWLSKSSRSDSLPLPDALETPVSTSVHKGIPLVWSWGCWTFNWEIGIELRSLTWKSSFWTIRPMEYSWGLREIIGFWGHHSESLLLQLLTETYRPAAVNSLKTFEKWVVIPPLRKGEKVKWKMKTYSVTSKSSTVTMLLE